MITLRRPYFMLLSLLTLLPACSSGNNAVATDADGWPRKVLVTNDDGIDDLGVVALARAFAKIAETVVVAPLDDRSGSSGHTTIDADVATLEIEPRQLGKGITAYALDGYPADCFLFAMRGLLRDDPPDLVVSGINGSPNLGAAWFSSGTIAAARAAAFAGLPAIAISGCDDDDPEGVDRRAEWIVALARSRLVRELTPGQYLTVSFPRTPVSEIRGVRVVERAPLDPGYFPIFVPTKAMASVEGREVWQALPGEDERAAPAEDVAAYVEGYIAVVPMVADEIDREMLADLKGKLELLPGWE